MLPGIPHEYFTVNLPGIGGEIKRFVEDFEVEEVPLYDPEGRGEHCYVEIEKRDIATSEAIRRLAGALRVRQGAVGYAGLKDRRGVTRQTLSFRGVAPETALELDLRGITVRSAKLHRNKLRIGHLRGNRFAIRVRDVDPDASQLLPPLLDRIQRHGVPNFFGHQRFGTRMDAHFVGRLLIHKRSREALDLLLGSPSSVERHDLVIKAREAFMNGDVQAAYETFPGRFRDELRMLKLLVERPDDYSGAIRRLSPVAFKMYLSAYQSYLFNLVLAERLRRVDGDLARLLRGDLAYLHRNGAVFRVEDPADEQQRADEFEISASGPLFGRKMPAPGLDAAAIETAILEREGVDIEELRELVPSDVLEGQRRAIRLVPQELSWHLDGGDLVIRFFLPKGAYATTVLREITKNEFFPPELYACGERSRHELWQGPVGAAGTTVDVEGGPAHG